MWLGGSYKTGLGLGKMEEESGILDHWYDGLPL